MPAVPAVPVAAPVPAGLDLAPFRAVRYASADLAAVTTPPYDVIDERTRSALEARDPHNAVRLVLPRDDTGPGSRYAAAARLLQRWRTTGVLAADRRPALYVYEQQQAGHVQRGLVGALALAPFDAGVVLPHENTMAGPVADRLALMEATRADLEPIFLVYAGGAGAAARVVADAEREPALADFDAEDGSRHRLWGLTDPATLEEVRRDLAPRRATIADGHHRYTTYLQRQAARYAAGDGSGPWDRGLVLLVDTTTFGPQVLPIHRVVASLPWEAAVDGARRGFAVSVLPPDADPTAALHGARGRHPVVLADGRGRAALLESPAPERLRAALPADRSPAWRGLDVSVVHHLLVRGLWQLEDDEHVVGFAHDAEEALDAARRAGGTAVLLRPTPVEAVGEVAAADDRMPRKSTLFVPKPRTGVVLRTFDEG